MVMVTLMLYYIECAGHLLLVVVLEILFVFASTKLSDNMGLKRPASAML